MRHHDSEAEAVLDREIREAQAYNASRRSRAAGVTPFPERTARGLSRGGPRPAPAPRIHRPIPARELRKGDVLLRWDRYGYLDRQVVWNVAWAGGCSDRNGCPHVDVWLEWAPQVRMAQDTVVQVEMPRPAPTPADDPFGVPNTLLTEDELRGLF